MFPPRTAKALLLLLCGLPIGLAWAQIGSAPAPAAVKGPRYVHPPWGMSFAVPEAWVVTDRQAVLVVASKTNTGQDGLAIVRFVRKTSLDQLRQGYADGLNEDGLRLTPSAELQNFSAGGLKGLAGELAGTSKEGYRVRGRIVGVVSAFGDAAVVLGLATEDKYAQLKPRVDTLAASLAFTQPRTPPAKDFLAGRYEAYSGSSSGSFSSESRMSLCADGTFGTNRETHSSGSGGTYGGQGRNGGRWTADGDEFQGTVTLMYGNGARDQMNYVTSTNPKDRSYYGPAVRFGNKLYQKTGDGSCSR
jgi:hypothetical protein